MNLNFRGKRLSGILAVVPANERTFLEEMKNYNFPEARSLKLKEVMGYNKRRMVTHGVCVSDLAVAGMERLFQKNQLGRNEFDAMILVTQSPDHFMPPTSNIIQGRLNLKQDLLCLDINQGCAGYVIGLIQAFMLLDQDSIQKVVLINADVLSRKTSPQDRNSYPLIGDAASITIVERGEKEAVIYADLKMDGTRHAALIIPAGGFRLPSTPDTCILEDAGDNNLRAKDHLRMDGSTVFNFVQAEVPKLIEGLLARAGIPISDVDYYLSHQANRFMIQKLADKLKVPQCKMPNNIVEHFGNSSSVTIPLAITYNLSNHFKNNNSQVCLAGFGAGLTWSAMLMQLGNLDFCEIAECA